MRCLGSIDINNVAYSLAQLSDYSFIRSTEDFRWVYKDGSATQQYISSAGTDFIPVLKPYPTTFGESAYKPFSNYRAKFEYWSYRNQSGPQDLRIGIRIDDEENTILSSAGWGYDDSYLRLYVAIVLDDTNECGYIVYSYYVQGEHPEQYADGYGMSINGGNSASGRLIYDIFGYNGGGAGSGYIGNSLLSNKKMVGYNVPTSSAESTKTESVNEVSASAVSGKPKSGNGFARIKFLRDLMTLESVNKNQDVTNYVYSQSDGSSVISSYISGFGNNVGTDKILKAGTADKTLSLTDGVYEIIAGSSTHCNILIPIQRIAIKKMTFKAKVNKTYSTSFAWGAVDIADIPDSSSVDYSSLNCIRRLPCNFSASGYERVWDRNTDDWESFVFTWQNTIHINYFGFEANNSYVAIKDVIFFE